MSTAEWGNREAPKNSDPEDYRVGKTVAALMWRTEMTPEGYLNRRPITQKELALEIGVSVGLISRIVNGTIHVSNPVLMKLSKALGVDPIVIKRPDPEMPQQRLPFAA